MIARVGRLLFVWTVVLLLLAFTGCASRKLVEDRVFPAIQAGYPTLEFRACGERFHGLGICPLAPGANPDSVALEVQGYAAGTARIVSTACGLDKTITYRENELFRVPIPELKPSRNCLVSIVMNPDFPPKTRETVPVFGLEGHLAIRLLEPPETWKGLSFKATAAWRVQMDLPVGPYPAARIAIRGCGSTFYREVKLDEGVAHIELSEALKRTDKPALCLAEGVALVRGVMPRTFTLLVAQYATALPADPEWSGWAFGPLATPRVELKKTAFYSDAPDLYVDAPEGVSIVSLDDRFEMRRSAHFRFDRGREHTLRLLTSKGRSVLGEWSPAEQVWIWTQ